MTAKLIIVAIYAISVVITWNAIRKNLMVTGTKPGGMEMFFVILPAFNVALAVIYMFDTNDRLPGKRSIGEAFFVIKKEDYWRNERRGDR